MKNLILIMIMVFATACSTTFEKNEGSEHNNVKTIRVMHSLQAVRSGN